MSHTCPIFNDCSVFCGITKFLAVFCKKKQSLLSSGVVESVTLRHLVTKNHFGVSSHFGGLGVYSHLSDFSWLSIMFFYFKNRQKKIAKV